MTLHRLSFAEYPAHNQCYCFSLHSNFDFNNSNFNLIHIDIHSVNCNLDEFMCKIQNLGAVFHVIVLSETWITDELNWIEIPGFSSYHSIRTRAMCGGVTVLVDSDLESNLIADLLVNNEIYESIGVEIKINRPLSSSISDFNTNFFQLINSVSHPCKILGDFNIDTISTVRSAVGIDFTDRFSCLDNYDSLINILTRKNSSTATCIDHIYVKSTSYKYLVW